MQNNDALELRISRVIPAQKWKIIRLLTKVWEYPAYLPFVKEVKVLEKYNHTIRTKWRVLLEGIPISWTEEETFIDGTVVFRAEDGDLKEFRGEWNFYNNPEGTQVVVNVALSTGIPAIKDFADAHLKKLITRCFEAILEGLEKRLISVRYSGLKKGDTSKLAGFGIVGHLYNYYHLEHCLKMLRPDFQMPSREFLGQLFHITPSFKLYDIMDFKSKTQDVVNGSFIVATFIPDMIEKDIWTIFSKVVRACKLAEKSGVGIVTLGGFTSIVAERIGKEISSEVDVPVTTGNSFTAAMTIDGVNKAASLLGADMGRLKVAIVGGTGDIGSACARVLARQAKELIITGRTRANISRVSKDLAKIRHAKITATADNEAAVKDADIVISAASATSSILKADWFKPGSIICDVGYPKNISYTPTKREDILIFSGGLAKPPTPFFLPIDIGLPSEQTIYGCFSESIILALEKRFESFSFGRGNISVEKICEIRELGKKHGFEVADFYWGNKLIGEDIIQKVKQARKETT